jgi:hypothetical protein
MVLLYCVFQRAGLVIIRDSRILLGQQPGERNPW